mmetsp:Transcript_5602/g.13506  ORF Transcript_5602/g.13506 Transcript_5602/m.13506 type:complete len:209 (-) Transcript_5602:496-1122(-)
MSARRFVRTFSAPYVFWYRPVRMERSTVVLSTHWIIPVLSLRGTTEKVRMYKLRRRLSTSLTSSRLIIVLKSIMRLSFLKSSLGLHRNLYVTPSEPVMRITTGAMSEFMTSIWSPNAWIVTLLSGNGLCCASTFPLLGRVGNSISCVGTSTWPYWPGVILHSERQSWRMDSCLFFNCWPLFRVMLHSFISSATRPLPVLDELSFPINC